MRWVLRIQMAIAICADHVLDISNEKYLLNSTLGFNSIICNRFTASAMSVVVCSMFIKYYSVFILSTLYFTTILIFKNIVAKYGQVFFIQFARFNIYYGRAKHFPTVQHFAISNCNWWLLAIWHRNLLLFHLHVDWIWTHFFPSIFLFICLKSITVTGLFTDSTKAINIQFHLVIYWRAKINSFFSYIDRFNYKFDLSP